MRLAPGFNKRQLRALTHAVHQWAGLTLGLVFAVLGLSGSLLVFYPEIDLWLNPVQQVRAGPAPDFSLQQAIDALHRQHPTLDGPWRLEMPIAEGRPINARYARPAAITGRSFAPLMLTLDPETLHPTSSRIWGDYAMTWLYNLHYTLLFDKPGRYTVGVVGLFALLSLLSGLYLWWPSARRWRAALQPQIRPGIVRATYDWHVLSGSYGLLLLLVLAFTGVMLALPEYARPLLNELSPLRQMPHTHSLPQAGQAMIDADHAVAAARAELPGSVLRWLETPAGETGSYRVNLWQPGDPGYRFPRSNVWIDAYSGRVLAVRDSRRQSAGDTFLAWQHPLHNGEAFGLPGRILACLGGLLPALLWVSGLMRWRQKRHARAKHGKRL
jgi:uncharacterized iron-regulated membrane protein